MTISDLIQSDKANYTSAAIEANYSYKRTVVENSELRSVCTEYQFVTNRNVQKTGLMMVGWGGNNGSTLTAGWIANKNQLSWKTKDGEQSANYFGSMLLSSTTKIGTDLQGKEVYAPFNKLLPMLDPNDLVIGGWDICADDLSIAMDKAKVLEPDLKLQIQKEMQTFKPLPSIYAPHFIAENQKSRANNTLNGTLQQKLEKIQSDIRQFKEMNHLDIVIVLWTATTERFSSISNSNSTKDELLNSIKQDSQEIAPSTVFAVASILEGCPFINGSPQNTLVPGVVDLAKYLNVPVAGDDFKSGQTKIKSVLVDFLIQSGIKPLAITSYNHLGNNDGLNLSNPPQFKSKEISKSNVVDDMVQSNSLLYKPNEHPDHTVVIKYVPAVGDSKRALDEYYNEIFLGGRNTIAIHNTCEDSLLAAPLMLDLVIMTELLTRIFFKKQGESEFRPFDPVLSYLSFFLKAPMVPQGAPIVNVLQRQRRAIEELFRACLGLDYVSELGLEYQQ